MITESKPGKKLKSENGKGVPEKLPVYVPNIPEPTKREELMKYWMNLTLDDKTANRMLWISENASKVCRRTEEVCPVLDRPERYDYSPQVLCKEGIWSTRAYWEVEYSGWVVVGATYDGALRRASCGQTGLGENEESWGLCWSGTLYEVWYNSEHRDIKDAPVSSTIGVYVDQPAGIINFYIVTGEGAEKEVQLLHQVKTTLEKKIIPGFWMGIQSTCNLFKLSESRSVYPPVEDQGFRAGQDRNS